MIYDSRGREVLPGELRSNAMEIHFQGRLLTWDIFFFAGQQRKYWSKEESEKRIQANREKFEGRFPGEKGKS